MLTYKNMKEWEDAVKTAHGDVSFARNKEMTNATAMSKGKTVGSFTCKMEGQRGDGMITEMALAFGTVSPMDVSPNVSYETAADAPISVPDESVTIGSPYTERSPADISVYSQSITPVSFAHDAGIVAFDIVFSVGIVCDGNTSKTYQIIKRIGIDKVKLAADAENGTPLSIVESTSTALKKDAEATKHRFRRLAGLE